MDVGRGPLGPGRCGDRTSDVVGVMAVAGTLYVPISNEQATQPLTRPFRVQLHDVRQTVRTDDLWESVDVPTGEITARLRRQPFNVAGLLLEYGPDTYEIWRELPPRRTGPWVQVYAKLTTKRPVCYETHHFTMRDAETGEQVRILFGDDDLISLSVC